MNHPSWTQSMNLYEVNLRQYTPEGTFRAFQDHLPRLRAMGVDVLWLMPIQPIGVKNRKGTLGSCYSVRDYQAVNPEFGTLKEFRALVHHAHRLGMKVLLDWVANHTAWDHVWVTRHPEWYQKNAAGEIHSYLYDNGKEPEAWSDVVGLDYRNPDLGEAMIEAMLYWIRETDIDGYRCDVAGLVPTSFWEQARKKLDAQKPVFLLAEWSTQELHRAFDMTYDWGTYDLPGQIVKGTKTVRDLMDAFVADRAQFPADAYRMVFTSNHDKNSWVASDSEHLGPAFDAFTALQFLLPGVPLIYGGQEANLDRRLAFFEKDPIDWKDFNRAKLYQRFIALKHGHPALWNGLAGGPLEILGMDDRGYLAFRRVQGGDTVTAVFNLSDQPRDLGPVGPWAGGTVPPWGFHVTSEGS